MQISKMQENIQKNYCILEIIALELVELNCLY